MDEQAFVLQRRGGISRYVVELIRAFDADPSLGVDVVLPFTRVWSEPALVGLPQRGLRRGPQVAEPWPLLAWAAARPRRRVPDGSGTGRGRRVDLVHHTFTAPRWLADYPGTPKAVTVHDMIPERFPVPRRWNPHLRKRAYVQQAALVLCVSESTKWDLLDIYGTPDAPVVVVPLAADARFSPAAVPPPGLPRDYVLYAGRRSGYKNFAVLARAFAEVAQEHPDLHLVATGGGPWSSDEAGVWDRARIGNRAHAVTVADDQVPGVYAGALAVAVPSKYEGFGLPVLEGMASGVAVIASDAASLPEVAGDAAVLVPPADSTAWAEALDGVVSDSSVRADLVRRGLARAAVFGWDRTARETAAAYRLVTSGTMRS